SVVTPEDTPTPIALLATDVDGDALLYTVVVGPAHGTLSGTAPTLVYTPAANYNGPDSFVFKATDGSAESNLAAVAITVTPVNDPPAAVDDPYKTNEGQALRIAAPGVLANDTDIDGGIVTLESGSLTIAWPPPDGPAPTGYVVHYGVASGVYDAKADAGDV